MAADDVARGALHLIRWGKKLVPATADEIEQFGSNAPRVKALIQMVRGASDDAVKLSENVYDSIDPNARRLAEDETFMKAFASMGGTRYKPYRAARDAIEKLVTNPRLNKLDAWGAADQAVAGESVADLLTPQLYKTMVDPLAAARRFDRTVSNAPESFTSVARNLAEMGQINNPKGVEVARRLSMEDPTFTQLVMSFIEDGMSLEDAMAAARALS
jgi:hypothetical protein